MDQVDPTPSLDKGWNLGFLKYFPKTNIVLPYKGFKDKIEEN